jgi:hypothetical protein
LFYLSPFVDFHANKDNTIFRNDLFNTITIAPPIKGDVELVLDELKNGISPDLVHQFIKQNFNGDNPQLLLDGLLKNGIIE